MINFGKVKDVRVWGITTQIADCRLPVGDSTGGTFTAAVNPLGGTLFWDRCLYVLQGVSVGGGATGGSFTVTVETDALAGYTALPIARAVLGPISPTRVVMTNVHNSASSPMPTHINIDATLGAPGSTQSVRFQCYAIAKQYRGVLGTQGSRTSERILQGSLVAITTSSADTTFILGRTDTDLGMGRMRLWDNAMFWAIAGSTITGTWDVDIVGRVGGGTVSIATTGTTGLLATQGNKFPCISQIGGQAINPTQVILTEVTAGTIEIADVVGIAKSGRGSQTQR
ncbi:MAG TPA: hypothetical protein DCP69_07090 [Candidatus Omnitrophica bacterium]|nr:hypothetical protein [Candidatus Omnitrophota bacterium]